MKSKNKPLAGQNRFWTLRVNTDAADPGNEIRRNFLLKRLYLYPFCCAIVFFLSDPFVPVLWIRAILTVILSVFPFLSVINLLYAKRNTLLRAQSKVLLQSLCTSVSAGYSLESAFMCARPTLEKAFGTRSLMGTSLRRLEKSLSAHEPLSASAVELCLRLDYIELLPVMHALSITRVVGTGVISILRNSCQMLSELIAVRSEVEANNAGKNTEAILLCLMPFGITFALSSFTGDYMVPAQSKPLGVMLMLLAFCIAVLSCGFLFGLIGEKKHKSGDFLAQQLSFSKLSRQIAVKLREFASNMLPQSYTTKQYEIFSELSYKPDEMFEAMLFKIAVITILAAPLSVFVLMFLHYSPFFSVPILFCLIFLIHYDVRAQALRRRETIMDEIPLFLSMLVTLLQSGVLLPKAIETCSAAFPDSGVMGGELRIINAQMLSGISAGEAIENFSSRTSIPEAQSALLLASRYESTGGSEVLGLLALQSNACWSLCRNASRKKREREAVAMILPMMLDFISVLIVAVTPALISLQLT